jgi:hypothetical protein
VVFKLRAMSGRATVTMVTSTRSMNVPKQTAMSGSHLRMGSSLRTCGKGVFGPSTIAARGGILDLGWMIAAVFYE